MLSMLIIKRSAIWTIVMPAPGSLYSQNETRPTFATRSPLPSRIRNLAHLPARENPESSNHPTKHLNHPGVHAAQPLHTFPRVSVFLPRFTSGVLRTTAFLVRVVLEIQIDLKEANRCRSFPEFLTGQRGTDEARRARSLVRDEQEVAQNATSCPET